VVRLLRWTRAALAVAAAVTALMLLVAGPAGAQVPPTPGIDQPTDGTDAGTDSGTIEIDLGGGEG
jgi:hypothetical protein